MRLSEAVAAFLERLADVRLASAHTVAAYRRDLKDFVAHVGDAALDDIRRDHVQNWLVASHARGLSPATLARRLSALRQAAEEAGAAPPAPRPARGRRRRAG
jgi:integrase/recombinase XerC